MKIRKPVREDWGHIDPSDIELVTSFRDFYGKTDAEIEEALSNNSIEMADSIRNMPDIPLQYYLVIFGNFVSRKKFPDINAPDIASCFIRTVRHCIANKYDVTKAIMPSLRKALEDVSKNQSAYYADKEVYGDFADILREIDSIAGDG